jgi:diamine N-acetyltransferase
VTQKDRVYLRAFRQEDISVWAMWFNDLEIVEHMNKGIFPNLEEKQARFLGELNKSHTDIQFAVVLLDGNKLIGTVGIHRIDWVHRHGSVSLLIGDKQCWGLGLGTESIHLIVRHAFTKVNLHRLTAGMWSSNLAARRSFEKNGFRLEGTLKESYFYKDRYIDEWVMGILREESKP